MLLQSVAMLCTNQLTVCFVKPSQFSYKHCSLVHSTVMQHPVEDNREIRQPAVDVSRTSLYATEAINLNNFVSS